MKVFMAELERNIILDKMYYLNYLSNISLLLLMFFGIFFGGNLLGGSIVGSSVNSLVVAYSLWILIVMTITNMGQGIVDEATSGTINQVYIMPIRSSRIFFIKGLVNLVIAVINSSLVLLLVMLLLNHWIAIPISVAIPYLLALVALMGLGYIAAALSLKFKQIGVTLQVFQYIYLGLVLYDFSSGNIFMKLIGDILPMYPIFTWIKNLIAGSNAINNNLLIVSVLNAAIWLSIGLLAFNRVDKNSRKQGTIGFF